MLGYVQIVHIYGKKGLIFSLRQREACKDKIDACKTLRSDIGYAAQSWTLCCVCQFFIFTNCLKIFRKINIWTPKFPKFLTPRSVSQRRGDSAQCSLHIV